VPSTASMPDETVPPRTFALLRWLEKSGPSEWRVHVMADHLVWLEVERPIAPPIAPAALITETTCLLLDLAPHLGLLESLRLGVPIAASCWSYAVNRATKRWRRHCIRRQAASAEISDNRPRGGSPTALKIMLMPRSMWRKW
jgi:hypothetical protein